MNKIRVLVKRPNEPPRSVWISDTLENLQRYVGGYIEVFPLATDMVVICDEEGRLKNKEYNCDICGVPFVGEIILAGRNDEDFTDLPFQYGQMRRLFPDLWKEED